MKSWRPSLAALAAVAALAWAPAASAADWVVARSPNFVVYSDVSGDIVQRHVETLELFDAVLHMKLGLKSTEPAARPLHIYLVSKQKSLAKANPGIRESVQGYYTASSEDVYAIAAFERHDMSTLLHEYVHHFMLANFPYGYPSWLVEGYAEYFMTFEKNGNMLEVGGFNAGRASWLQNVNWLPYDQILGVRPFQLRDPDAVAMYYAQSWALTHYMVSDPARSKQLAALSPEDRRGRRPREIPVRGDRHEHGGPGQGGPPLPGQDALSDHPGVRPPPARCEA